MGTRSTIAFLANDGQVTSIYCHWDGYISHNGAILYEHYQNADKVRELVSHGALSSLAENVSPGPGQAHSFDKKAEGVCAYYGRDRGESDVGASVYASLAEYAEGNDFQEYDYVFKEKNNTWYLFNTSTNKLQKLLTLVKKECKDVVERVQARAAIVEEKTKLEDGVATAQKKTSSKV